eukprot:TRINITY_DN2303_c0_g1_i1.p1 TRINITY_DN2303_c0_g1~~TRINITY_DN2303_c0_g1_i1.p1  ORF type:complete len:108 (-),score=1.62 TRINITY_DN2303_c0_g1_i1:439-762(-)
MQDVWEKQRFYPLKGWSCKLLPNDGPRWAYADDASHPKVKYDPDWRAIITSETDAEGWQYATSFHHSPSWGAVPMKKSAEETVAEDWTQPSSVGAGNRRAHRRRGDR